MDIKITRGSLTFESEKPLTVEGVRELIQGAELIGVPSEASISYMDYRWNGNGTTSITMNWEVKES